jgi:hypothetical protein
MKWGRLGEAPGGYTFPSDAVVRAAASVHVPLQSRSVSNRARVRICMRPPPVFLRALGASAVVRGRDATISGAAPSAHARSERTVGSLTKPLIEPNGKLTLSEPVP